MRPISRRARPDDGITLVELLVGMAVSAVVLAFVTGTVVHALRTHDRQTTQVAALNDAKRAFEWVTRDLRAADPLRVAEPGRVRLDARRGAGGTRLVTYARQGDELVLTDESAGTSRTLVDSLAAGEPLFRYHLVDGSTVTGVEGPVDPRLVHSITVRLQVQAGAGSVVDLENRVLLRNAAP